MRNRYQGEGEGRCRLRTQKTKGGGAKSTVARTANGTYTNLQPLWAMDNMEKGDTVDPLESSMGLFIGSSAASKRTP